MEQKQNPKVLLIGLDSADWDFLSEQIAVGKLPHLANLIQRGTSGPLRSLRPFFSPSLWATIATGKRPYQHGIAGFVLPTRSGRGLRTYESSSRSSPAIWEMLSSAHYTSNVVGWWNSAPAEKIRGVMVDETFRVAHYSYDIPWEVSPTSVHPSSLAEELAQCRHHPQQISMQLLQRLVPKLYEIDPSVDWRISAIAKIIAEDLTTIQSALYLIKNHPSDFTSLYLIGLDSLSHQGTSFREPTTCNADQIGIEHYGELVDRTYELYDEWIGSLVTAAGEETTIMLVSDHGFYHDDRKPSSLGTSITAPCDQHAPIGTFIVAGPNINQGASIKHTTLLDICPTLLTLFQLPVGRDMEGNILAKIFKSPPPIHSIASWDQKINRLPQNHSEEPCEQVTKMALQQLIALGYLPQAPIDDQYIFSAAYTDHLFHQALSYLEHDRVDAAIPLLEEAHHHSPERTDILTVLAEWYLILGAKENASTALKQFVFHRVRDAWQANQALQTKYHDPTKSLSTMEILEYRSLAARLQLDPGAVHFARLFAEWLIHPEEQIAEQLSTFATHFPRNFSLVMQAADVCFFHQWNKRAISLLQTLANWKKEESAPLVALANHENKQGYFERAVTLSREALDRNSLDHAAWLELGKALVAQADWAAARTAAIQAAGSFLKRPEAYKLLATIALQGEENQKLAQRYTKLAHHAEQRLTKLKNSFRGFSSRFLTRIFHADRDEEAAKLDGTRRAMKSDDGRAQGVSDAIDSQQFKLPVEVEDRNFGDDVASTSTPNFISWEAENAGATRQFVTAVELGKKAIQQPIIVTGIPRSGTSLLMQMLTAGGIDAVTDYQRLPDEHNPLGYFEHEKLKEVATHSHLLTAGKAAKVVIPLLWELPPDLNCYVILIRRPLEEVIESQHRMAGKIASFEELKKAYISFEVQTSEIIRQRPWRVLQLSHTNLLTEPAATAAKINDFLGGRLNTKAMAAVVQPSLHRVISRVELRLKTEV